MSVHRLGVAVAAIAYLGIGMRTGWAFASGWSDPSDDLSFLEPVFDAVVAGVYCTGAVVLVRAALAGRTRRVLAVPLLFVPASALALVVFLVAAGGSL